MNASLSFSLRLLFPDGRVAKLNSIPSFYGSIHFESNRSSLVSSWVLLSYFSISSTENIGPYYSEGGGHIARCRRLGARMQGRCTVDYRCIFICFGESCDPHRGPRMNLFCYRLDIVHNIGAEIETVSYSLLVRALSSLRADISSNEGPFAGSTMRTT